MSVQLCPCVRNTRDMVLFIMPTRKPETRDIPTNHCERTERARRIFFTFASKTYFSYRPETREKAIDDCERAEFCVFLHSSQYFVGESHSLSVHVLVFVTLVICLVHDDLYRPENQKLAKKTHKSLRASGASEPKFSYFCLLLTVLLVNSIFLSVQ